MGLFYRNQPFNFGEITYRNGGVYGPLKSSLVNLVIIAKGRVEIVWDGLRIDVSAPRSALIYNRSAVEFRYPRGVTTVVQWCETGEPAGSAVMRQKLSEAPVSLDTSRPMARLMALGLGLVEENNGEFSAFRDALGEALICAYLHHAHLDREKALIPEPVVRSKTYIDAHFCDPIDNARVAWQAGISLQYLVRLFRESYGLSPVQHIWNLRAEKGAHLLRQTALSVGEVAYQCGYKNPFHFSRHIKAVYGHHPTALRMLKQPLQPSLMRGALPDRHFAA
jgi:AraC family L-rhamnose operon regulatory protein RhaS